VAESVDQKQNAADHLAVAESVGQKRSSAVGVRAVRAVPQLRQRARPLSQLAAQDAVVWVPQSLVAVAALAGGRRSDAPLAGSPGGLERFASAPARSTH
jgi:hypothetical protein